MWVTRQERYDLNFSKKEHLRINLSVGALNLILSCVLAKQLGQLAVIDSRSRRDTKLRQNTGELVRRDKLARTGEAAADSAGNGNIMI